MGNQEMHITIGILRNEGWGNVIVFSNNGKPDGKLGKEIINYYYSTTSDAWVIGDREINTIL